MSDTLRTSRTELHRRPTRGSHDREVVNAILDEGFVCDVGFVDEGQPYVIPVSYARSGDALYLHGASASRMCGVLASGAPVCVTVTLVDGLVLARAAMNHSVNYRSVVILGRAAPIEDRLEKLEALRLVVEHIVPGRWDDCRQPSDSELDSTAVLRLPIEEASAKIRQGPPAAEPADPATPLWTGVLPLRQVPGEPVPDACEKDVPAYVRRYRRGR